MIGAIGVGGLSLPPASGTVNHVVRPMCNKVPYPDNRRPLPAVDTPAGTRRLSGASARRSLPGCRGGAADRESACRIPLTLRRLRFSGQSDKLRADRSKPGLRQHPPHQCCDGCAADGRWCPSSISRRDRSVTMFGLWAPTTAPVTVRDRSPGWILRASRVARTHRRAPARRTRRAAGEGGAAGS
jgi:hypothetical protein